MEDENKLDLLLPSVDALINLSEICRFCLSKTKSGISINDKCPSEESKEFGEDNIFNFVAKLKFVKIENNKNFPSQVCDRCYILIKICNDFSQLCQKSDTLLREYYKNSSEETKEKSVLIDDKNEIKILIQVPGIQEHEMSQLNYNINSFPSKKSNTVPSIKDEIQKLNIMGVNIFQTYKQKLNIISRKIKAESNLYINTKEKEAVSVLDEQNTCTLCSLKFGSVRDLNFHNVMKHGQKRFRSLFKVHCKNCPKSFNDEAKLQRHYKVIHKINKNEFPFDFPNNKIKELVKDVEKFYCTLCKVSEEFQTHDDLVQHMHSHKIGEARFYTCPYCKNLKFSTKVSLNEHYLFLHSSNEEMNGNENVEEAARPSNALMPHVNVLQQQPQNLNNFSTFLNILDTVVDSLIIVQKDKKSGFKLLCKNCNPPLEITSMSDCINHINTSHNGSKLLDDWVIERKAKQDGSWSCTECPASYSRKQSLYCHMREKHRQTILDDMKCPEPGCGKSFNTNRQLIQHGIAVHQKYFAYFHKVFKKVLQPVDEDEDKRVKNFECDICQKKYIYKTSLKKHIFESHMEKSVKNPVVCTYCGKSFSSKLNLKSHIEFVHEALFVSCPICKKKINFRTIGKHYKTHKTTSDMIYSKNSFLCNLCGKILKSKRSFEDHQKLHKNIRDELCDVCGSGFTTKKLLRLHKKIHEGIQRKVFNCDQCEKAFSGRQTLNRHLLTHSGKKNFICEMCSKCFYTLQELNRHVRYHKKEYRFDCQLCEMRFLDKSRFRHHMMRHRNVRPHKCQFCEKMFIVKGKMNLHMAAKHNVEVQSTKGVWKDPKTYVPLDDLL